MARVTATGTGAWLTLTLLGVLVGQGCSVLPTPSALPSPSSTPGASVMTEQSFNCKFSAALTVAECISAMNGHCNNATEHCLARYDHFTHQPFAMCCCNKKNTPVDQILKEKMKGDESRWSAWITNEDPGGEAGSGYCHVTACARPWTAQGCFGGAAICCAPGTRCGISRSTRSSCYGPPPPASPSRVSNADCCTADVGRTCSWLNGLWFFLWFSIPGSQPCCLRLEENCNKTCTQSQILLGLSVSIILMGGILMHKCKFRRRATPVILALVFACLQCLTALVNGEGWLQAATWVGSSCTFLMLCSWLAKSCCSTQKARHHVATALPGCSGPPVHIAVLILIEHYSNRDWDDVPDESMALLEKVLRTLGFTVMIIRDPRHAQFEGHVTTICGLIKGTTDSKVLIFVSCHARMIYGKRWIIPSDAGAGFFAWDQWISVDNFLRDLNEKEATNPHFIMLVNGCGVRSDKCEQLWWRLWHGSEDEISTDLDEVNVNIFYACGPGGVAFEDNLTAAFANALQDNPNRDLSEIFRVMRAELRHEGDAPRAGSAGSRRVRARQRLWFTTSDQPISLINHSAVPGTDVSFNSATSSCLG